MKTIPICKTRGAQCLLDRTGTSAVEFALVAPLFLMLFFGMVGYGIYLGASHSVQQIAADAARTAVAGLDASERRTLAAYFVDHDTDGYPFIDPGKLTIETNDNPRDPDQFVVEVRYDARNLPIWNLFPRVPMPGTTIARKSIIRVGGR